MGVKSICVSSWAFAALREDGSAGILVAGVAMHT